MLMILFNIILMIGCWSSVLFYKPSREEGYTSFLWFIIPIFVMAIYTIFIINYVIASEINNKLFLELTIMIPLIFFYTAFSGFIKESIYKKRIIIYPVMYLLGVAIFILSFLLGLKPMFNFDFICFLFFNALGIVIIVSSVIISITLGMVKDWDEEYFKIKKKKKVASKKIVDVPNDVDISTYNKDTWFLIFLFIIILIIIIGIFIFSALKF